MTQNPGPVVRLELVGVADAVNIAAAIALGNQARSTLGYLPFAAYDDAAARRGLVLAVDEADEPVGYALFALTSRHVRLVHLCVDSDHRRRGVARQLVEWISERHSDRAGILVWCRRDYNLGRMWSRLGFRRLEERSGRGRDGRTLVAWWRDHGHPTLFARHRADVIVRASVDLNVVRDLVDEKRTDRDESLALLSDQLADRLELVRTPALDLEIDAMDEDLRRKCARQAAGLSSVELPADVASRHEAELGGAANETDPIFAASSQGKNDIRYVSEAIAAGLNVFVTRDERLAAVLGESAAARGLRILRPAEVVVRIDELARAEAYRPGAVQATAFTRRLIPAGGERAFDVFVAKASGERLPALRGRVRSLTARGLERVGIFDPGGALVGVLILRLDGAVLDVPLLRVLEGPIAATLVRQLLFTLRREAIARGVAVIRLSDPHLARGAVAAAADDGFTPGDSAQYALVVDVCGDASLVSEVATAAARAASIEPPPPIRAGMAALAAAEFERIWWPAKLVDARLPSYLIPIRQTYSQELLGAPPGLFARPTVLGLSREHVYYRSPRGPRLEAPARLLWYMSGSAPGSVEPAAVVAASLLEEVVEDTPERLHTRFRHLGVWRQDQVSSAAFNGIAQALRFAYTETFDRPVSLVAVRRVVGNPPQGPLAIQGSAFAALYREGRHHA